MTHWVITALDPVRGWIDLALYAGNREPAGLDWPRLQKRVRKDLKPWDGAAHDQELLRKFSEAVGCWAQVEEKRIAEYLPPATVRRLVDLAPPNPGDPVLHAALYITQYLNEARAAMVCSNVADHLEFSVVARDPIHSMAVKAWTDWIHNPVHAMECEHCGTAFHPTRSDARFCGTACRTAAARDRREATA